MACVFLYLTFRGATRWSGRSMTLLDPTYAAKFLPIVASVSEHQATTWASFFFDLHFLLIFFPIGLFFCTRDYTKGKLYVALFGVLAVYFASVMVRLLLVLAPAVSILGGIGVSNMIRLFTQSIKDALKSRKR